METEKSGWSKEVDNNQLILIIMSALSALFFFIYFVGRYLFLGLGPVSKSPFWAELIMSVLLTSAPVVLYEARYKIDFFDDMENLKRGLSQSEGTGATILAWLAAIFTVSASLMYLYLGFAVPLFEIDSSLSSWRLYG